LYYVYYVWERLNKKRVRGGGGGGGGASIRRRLRISPNRWRQEHDRRRRRRRLWPRTAIGVVRACVRAYNNIGSLCFPLRCTWTSACTSLARSSAGTRVHTYTARHCDSRVLDECAGSRASVCTHRRVAAAEVFRKKKNQNSKKKRLPVRVAPREKLLHVSSGILISARRTTFLYYNTYCC